VCVCLCCTAWHVAVEDRTCALGEPMDAVNSGWLLVLTVLRYGDAIC
jgi:hypothetical protein